MDTLLETQGPNGSLANFLNDLGPVLLEKYKPKAIVVFSAHWESPNERLVTDYGSQNPLLMDCALRMAWRGAGRRALTTRAADFGFPDELYEIEFESSGDHALSERIVELYKAVRRSYCLPRANGC